MGKQFFTLLANWKAWIMLQFEVVFGKTRRKELEDEENSQIRKGNHLRTDLLPSWFGGQG